jgi:hypothetical protein
LIGFSLLLLALLPLYSFAQAHLLNQRSFRATDTDHSGGDHICDLRRDSSGNGRPDRLGDCVTVSGTVIVEPSTFETGGWLFWIRAQECGILTYGEPEEFVLGDSVQVRGCVRLTNGNYFFPETGLATLGDIAIENMGVSLRGRNNSVQPRPLTVPDFKDHLSAYGGNLVIFHGLSASSWIGDKSGNLFAFFHDGLDSIMVYMDKDTGCSIDFDLPGCYSITGVITSMKTPQDFAPSPSWCIAPRGTGDITPSGCFSENVRESWSAVKIELGGRK